jgi:outer membrane protein assembly factor BamE (lipoprotein component of BamABCDE complex)
MLRLLAGLAFLLALSAPDQAQAQAQAQIESETCRFINSTDLRRYLIKEQVVEGMTREHVRSAFGNPPETYDGPQEVWIYQTRSYGALTELTYVYFKDGCVERVAYRRP